MIEIAAITAGTVLLCLVIFQIALILGAPIGRFAWGGNNTVLPTNLRVASASSIALYLVFAMFVLGKANVISTPLSGDVLAIGTWILTGYFILGVVMNGMSRSKPERMVMTPVAAALALLFLIVAL